MSEETKKVHYTGSSAIEVRVGNFQQTFLPDEVAEIEDPRFRIELLDRDDFKLSRLDVRPGEKPAGKAKRKKAKTKSRKPAKAAAKSTASEKAAATPPAQDGGANSDDSEGVNNNE